MTDLEKDRPRLNEEEARSLLRLAQLIERGQRRTAAQFGKSEIKNLLDAGYSLTILEALSEMPGYKMSIQNAANLEKKLRGELYGKFETAPVIVTEEDLREYGLR